MFGAILPGIGGSMARAGMVEGLYVGELAGLILIWLGYHVIANDRSWSVHSNQRLAAA
jgi:sulfite exporter TauE/SafE